MLNNALIFCNFIHFPLTFGKMIFSKRNLLLLFYLVSSLTLLAHPPKIYGKHDYLHGKLNNNRNWFDVKMYDITLRVNPEQKYIQGHNTIFYQVLKPAKMMQLDVHGLIKIDSIIYNQKHLKYTRDSSVILIKMPHQKQNSKHFIHIYFSGNPLIAKKAPWDGGFVFTKDSSGNDWVGLACQGLGASTWLPCKDHLSDEADSVNINLQVPSHLTGVSNGRFVGKENLNNGYTSYKWQVRYPINNYNITVNIGNYKHFGDEYNAKYNNINKPLTLDYYVLDYNLNKAKKHFEQVKTMMACYEKYFGPYPFWNDGYKLVETPYWGMEHQSAVSYGNDYSNTRWDFDFIIIHESAHEWFGNSITSNDPAELWLHESFTTHAEAVFVECNDGKESAHKYLKMQKRNIENKQPMLGTADVYFHDFADNDIYYKGSWMLYTIRHVIDNDTLWFNSLLDYCNTFKYTNINTKQCIDFWVKRTGKNLAPIFEQYLTQANLPTFEYILTKSDNEMLTLKYRWTNVVKGFEMPIKATLSKNDYQTITPTSKWRVVDLNYFDPKEFKILTDQYLIETRKVEN